MKRLMQLGLTLFFMLVSSNLFAAVEDLNPEGKFKVIPALMMIALLVLFVLVGVFAKAQNTEDYWAAGRGVGQLGGGMAIASNWMSAASYLGMAGLIYLKGYFALSYVLGWTGGYVLLLVLMAGQVRRYGKYTAPDFIGDRYYSTTARLLSSLIVIVISFVYSVGQYKGIGMMFNWIFGINYQMSVFVGTGVVLAYVLISGMLGATKNMQVQYVVIVITFFLPLFFIAHKLGYFSAVPQIGYGAALWDIGHGGNGIAAASADPSYYLPFSNYTAYHWFALCITLMLGTAGLPHVIGRFYVVPRVSDARWQVVWGLFCIALVYWTAPCYAAFAKFSNLLGTAGVNVSPDAIVVNAAELAGLPEWFAGFLAAGGVSAAFSTVGGLLMAGASAFAHDIYFRVMNPNATEEKKMLIARVGTIILGVSIIIAALNPPALIAQITAVAFSLGANTFFPLFLLGLWWSRTTKEAAIAGMVVGLVVTFGSMFLPKASVLAYYIPFTSSAILGVPAVLITMIVVSLMTPEPSQEIKELLYKVHNDE
ncbi:VC_2705 family sodium/solute symporter [Desulfuromonas thiophila]|uniref:Cation/acetate symporter n=1 Tax=Desulfuromonas thiophila TaxID=57664 RepID=A0A1G6YE90_9BACT|nr:VC_2705 family sodium/solute symporter [Desulfuromonas thiophila]SDD88323.1 cation/acetate symporter [Desulfuromonas thiophila]